MELFELAFKVDKIYDMLFFNIKAVTEYENAYDFKKDNPVLFKRWEMICDVKYKIKGNSNDQSYMLMLDDAYKMYGHYYPEFTKIVGISYAIVKAENNELKRDFVKIIYDDEFKMINEFRNHLVNFSMNKPDLILCGHNVINNDIPLFIKRLLINLNKWEEKNNIIPPILKRHLKAKPWDSVILDTLTLWKFNGVSNTPLQLIADSIGLKYNIEIDDNVDFNKKYWSLYKEEPDKAMKYVITQSTNQTNIIIQLVNVIRSL
jgi:hypothetical protein